MKVAHAEDPDAVPVLDAATVMLVRDGARGVEVFMLRRNLRSDFVGGAYVFPGGAVDPADGDPGVAAWCRGRDDRSASRALDVASGGLAFWIAAIRETFEEAGLLLAVDDAGDTVHLDHPDQRERFAAYRAAVDAGEMSLLELCTIEQLQLDVGDVGYFSRWVTPYGAVRRYDTRFFVGAAPPGQTALHDDRETIANVWIRPTDALQQHADGRFDLIFPTVRSLEALEQFDDARSVVEHARAIERVDPIVPRIVEADGGTRIVLPNDEVYDAITSARLSD